MLLLLSFIWSHILTFTFFVNSNSSRFCSIRSLLTLTELVCVSDELWGWSIIFEIYDEVHQSLTTSFFSLLPTFDSCSLFLVYLFSMTVKFLITSVRLSMVICLLLSSSFNNEIVLCTFICHHNK